VREHHPTDDARVPSLVQQVQTPVAASEAPEQVEGDIVAKDVTIGGRVRGTIRANRVKLTSNAIVEGDIYHRSLSIEENARFEGSSRREETVIDVTQVPISRPVTQTEDIVAAMEDSRKHNGPLDNKWHATE
jgi:hypothetical protein